MQSGIEFKQLRKKQHITLKEAAAGICSIQMLSRWENNQGHMDFNRVLKLCERISLSATEYIALAKLDPQDHIAQILEESWNNHDRDYLEKLAQAALNKYESSQDPFDLDYAAIACSLYYKTSQHNIFPIAQQNELNHQLSKITVWGHEFLSLFANVIPIINPRIIYQISVQVISNISFIKKAGEGTFHFSIAALFEAVIGLITKSQFKFADQLLTRINQIDLPDNEMLLIVGRKFLNAILTFHNTANDEAAVSIIHFLTNMDMQTTAAYFLQILNQVKALN
ncbi:helix-turn-helix domain-containing protein [Lactobacillus sp. M0398]|uniref:Rgg/GadR/MutR family transcriptional regulator n=1 Tax=unclassified Lactobacillus TaxID=2620435 RepID=UPI0018DE808F|nr:MULTISPECIES: Rgg/GadR/MutR family transcriptional regulator [unclassified Lactobacillus]MBI0121318.1 helix-turn-helix domain-containing protein [Lactobacillus sp. M0398]MBI0123465.1 helix-turn-helix domain-containing protein [Lactobacillus sp. W8174]MBI0135470.1 helix-turn-helix domain-containing protein [Lactobacillus sp. W8173]